MFHTGGNATALTYGRNTDSETRSRFPSLFCSLGWSVFDDDNKPSANVREPRTGVEFPAKFCLNKGDKVCPKLTGVGCVMKCDDVALQ